jgi:organic hydroperoxide reductase OsmC/OhrA
MAEGERSVSMVLEHDYQFLVDFNEPGLLPLLVDEPEPLGDGAGPGATRLLAAAVGNCLSASLLFCLRRARIDVEAMRTSVSGSVERNEKGRLRMHGMTVRIEPTVPEDQRARMRRCLELFEDFCVVTQSVREGINVEVEVEVDVDVGGAS